MFYFFLALAIVYVFLYRAIYSTTITRIEHGNHVDIYVNDTLIGSSEQLDIELYEFSAE